MEVDQSAYPPLDNLKRNYNDPPFRVKWRSKQVVDYAFMFYVGKNLSKYYMQIEDDVISSMKLLPKIKDGIAKAPKQWTTLEFAYLGFIGKLYKAEDLERLAEFLMLFYAEQPVDWLFNYFYQLLAQKKHILVGKSIFQHFGLHSSLNDKKKNHRLDTLLDKSFVDPDPLDLAEAKVATPKPSNEKKEPTVVLETKNPAADVFTSMEVYMKNLPYYAYASTHTKYFWGKSPTVNDTFTINFRSPIALKSVGITTGHPEHPTDKLTSGILEYSKSQLIKRESTDNNTYITLGQFLGGNILLQDLNIHHVQSLRIRVTEEQMAWVIIAAIRINQ